MGYDHADMLLYHGLDNTGAIEISVVSSTGPWTKLTLTSTQRVSEALREWQDLANAAFPGWGFQFFWDNPSSEAYVWFGAAEPPCYLRLPACLAELFGITGANVTMVAPLVFDIGAQGVQSDVPPLGLIGSDTPSTFAIGVDFPKETSTNELVAYRAGRAATDSYGRASEVLVDFFIGPERWPAVRNSPLLSGHAAFWFAQDASSSDVWGEGNPTGAMVVRPLEPLVKQQDSPEDPMWIRLRCLRDPEPTGPCFYRSRGEYGDFADLDSNVAARTFFDGLTLKAASLSLWVRAAVGADALASTVFHMGDAARPSMALAYISGEVHATLYDDNGAHPYADEILFKNTDGAWHHIMVAARASQTGLIGIECWYDGVSYNDGTTYPGSPTFATAVNALRFFGDVAGARLFRGDIANIAVLPLIPPGAEIAALASAGPKHNPRDRDPSGVWPGYVPRCHYHRRSVNGVVQNDGDGGACSLVLGYNTRSLPL